MIAKDILQMLQLGFADPRLCNHQSILQRSALDQPHFLELQDFFDEAEGTCSSEFLFIESDTGQPGVLSPQIRMLVIDHKGNFQLV